MTLPARRFLDREERKKPDDDGPKVWVCDYDETITTAPEVIARIATALKALGDKFYVLTGNDSPRDDLIKQLNDYGVPFDDLVQYSDTQSDGIARAHYLKQMGAWCGIDNRIDRAGTYVQVCPHLFVIAEPPKVAKEDAKGSKKKAKKAAKKLNRSESRGYQQPPPNLRMSDSPEDAQPERECGTCEMWERGFCWGFSVETRGEWVCDAWVLDPDWQDQDAAQDAADGELTP